MTNQKEVKRWLIKKHAFLKWPLVWLVLMSMILSATAVIFAYFSKLTLDAAQARHVNNFILGSILIVSILVFQLVFKALYNYLMVFYKGKTDKIIKAYVYEDIIHKKQNALDNYHSGQLMNYLQSDVNRLSDGLVDIIPRFVFLFLRFIFAFVLLFFLDQLFAFIMLGFGSLLLVVSLFIRNEIKRRHHVMQDKEAMLRSFMQEGLEHVMLIKSFEAEDYTKEHLNTHQTSFLKAFLSKQRISILAGTALQGFFSLGYAFALIYGAYKIGMNVLTFGSLIAIIQLVEYMQSPFSSLSALMPKYYAMLASSERLMAIESLPNETKQSIVIAPEFETIVFSDVSFKYDKAYILEAFNLTIPSQSFSLIKGSSGIGKTTLFKLMLGLIEPNNGELFVQYTDKTFDLSVNTRSLFTYVPQGLMILSGTIKDNIIYNKKHVKEETLIKACEVACIYDDIMALPKGFKTMIGERGHGLSEGQLQRLAIARALIKDAPILLLDEITSALDADTEEKVLKNIKEL
ncbi:MAG: ABC transporter ATP-binding protein, partial [Candidatus Izemoplasmataceae bacterium]